MVNTPLILTAAEVPLGATVYLVPPESTEPYTAEGALRKLYGGVPLRPSMYPLDDMIHRGEGSLTATRIELTGFMKGVRFSPVNAYTQDNAPADGTYAVFVDGRRQMSEDPVVRQPLKVAKTGDGTLYVANYFPFAPHGLAHNERFALELKHTYGWISDDDLIARIARHAGCLVPEYQPEVSEYKLEQQVEALAQRHRGTPSDLEEQVEALAQRHRGTPSDLVRVIKAAAPSYLRQASLPQDAQLVRTNQIDAVPM